MNMMSSIKILARACQPRVGLQMRFNKSGSSKTPPHWNYSDAGPSVWPKLYPQAKGSRQSPVDLCEATYCEPSSALTLHNYSQALTNMGVQNKGTTVAVESSGSSNAALTGVHDKDVSNRFLLDHFHFHFGSGSCEGAEHSFNGKTYPMEVHFVHYLQSHGNVSEASSRTDGLSVLGFVYEISKDDNPNYKPLLDGLRHIHYKDQAYKIKAKESITLRSLLPESMDLGFYWYKGSLTTPPCSETVLWIVFKDTIKLSMQQLGEFQKLHCCTSQDKENSKDVLMQNNYRPVQPLNVGNGPSTRTIKESRQVKVT